MPATEEFRHQRRIAFSIRDVLWLTVIVALALSWWHDTAAI